MFPLFFWALYIYWTTFDIGLVPKNTLILVLVSVAERFATLCPTEHNYDLFVSVPVCAGKRAEVQKTSLGIYDSESAMKWLMLEGEISTPS